jgi:hypothetical protein
MIISLGKSKRGNLSLRRLNRKVTEANIHGEIPGAKFEIFLDCEQIAEKVIWARGECPKNYLENSF